MIHAPRLEDGKIFVPQPFCEINFVLDCAAHISFPWCGISRDVMVSLLSTKRTPMGANYFLGSLHVIIKITSLWWKSGEVFRVVEK